MEKKLWYAVMIDEDDSDWGDGTFDRAEAIRKMKEMNDSLEGDSGLERTAYIAVIDGNYNEDGEATSDTVCVEEIHEDDL